MELEKLSSTHRHHPAGGSEREPLVTPVSEPVSPMIQLQKQAGNQAVQQLLHSGYIQAKLAISNPVDPEEREADSVANTIMRKAAGAPSSTPCSCSQDGEMCEECQQKQSQPTISRRASAPSAPAHVPRSVSDVLRSPGHPLDSATRAFFEPRFGHDFSQVRIHSDAAAEQSAQEVNANAYTVGHSIVFGRDQFATGTQEGRTLIAHELTHVVQQSGSQAMQEGANGNWSLQRNPKDSSNAPAGAGVAVGNSTEQAQQGESSVAQFYSAVEAVRVTERAKKLVDEAVAKLLREQGPQLAELQKNIDALRKPGYYEDIDGQTRRLAARQSLEAQKQQILDAYNPGIERRSEAPTIPGSFIRLPYSTVAAPKYGPPELSPLSMDPLQNANYAPDIVPDKAVRFGKYGGLDFKPEAVRSSVGDAYAYNLKTDNFQVANDLERLARAGYTEIHIATGSHGTPVGDVGGPESEILFLKQDARSIYETMQRHPGLKIIPYNMADPVQVAKFDALQALAADGQLPGGATVAAFCYSRTRVLDPNPDPAGPYESIEVLDGRPSQGGFTALFGALSIYSGLNDPNRTVGGLKVFAGSAQIIGGASFRIGLATDSLAATRFGSVLGEAGGYVMAPLVLYDFYRDMSRKFEPGSQPVSGEEAVYEGVDSTLKLAGILFPEAAIGALALDYAVKPLAEKGSEYLTPMFVGAISRAYGISENMVWGMH